MKVNDLLTMEGFTCGVIPDPEREIEGVYIGDLLSWVMGKAKSGDAWITIMSNVNILAVASLCDCACVILSENVTLDSETLETARAKDINVIYTSKSSFEVGVLLNQAL